MRAAYSWTRAGGGNLLILREVCRSVLREPFSTRQARSGRLTRAGRRSDGISGPECGNRARPLQPAAWRLPPASNRLPRSVMIGAWGSTADARAERGIMSHQAAALRGPKACRLGPPPTGAEQTVAGSLGASKRPSSLELAGGGKVSHAHEQRVADNKERSLAGRRSSLQIKPKPASVMSTARGESAAMMMMMATTKGSRAEHAGRRAEPRSYLKRA